MSSLLWYENSTRKNWALPVNTVIEKENNIISQTYVVSFLLKSNKPKFDLFFIFLTKNCMDKKLQCAKVSFVLKRSLVQRSNQVII